MAWGCKHAGPCGWAVREPMGEWWCDECERAGYVSPGDSGGASDAR